MTMRTVVATRYVTPLREGGSLPGLVEADAALYIHHTWRDPDAHARGAFERIRDHVLLPYAGPIVEADARNAHRIHRSLVADLVAAIPELWLPTDPTMGDSATQRAAYVRYLARRLEAPRAFVEEAERARPAE